MSDKLNQSELKVSNGAKIRNRYNQVPHLTQDTNGKVTNSQKTPQTRAKRSALSQQVKTFYVIGAMTFIQRFRSLGSKTFIELALSYLHKMIYLKPVGRNNIHFVGDRYDVAD